MSLEEPDRFKAEVWHGVALVGPVTDTAGVYCRRCQRRQRSPRAICRRESLWREVGSRRAFSQCAV